MIAMCLLTDRAMLEQVPNTKMVFKKSTKLVANNDVKYKSEERGAK